VSLLKRLLLNSFLYTDHTEVHGRIFYKFALFRIFREIRVQKKAIRIQETLD